MLINGSTSYFPSKQGLFQGDPLSPFLFIIMAKALERSLIFTTTLGKIEGIKPTSSCQPISLQQFVDETIIASISSIPQAKVVKKILGLYEFATGHGIKFEKSNIYFLNTDARIQLRLTRIIEFQVENLSTSYLGIPLFKGGIKEDLRNVVIDRYSKILVGWKGMMLSQDGKV